MHKEKLMYCDFCKGPCFHEMEGEDPSAGEKQKDVSHEYATLKAHWGYFSNKDLFYDEADICETCYDTMINFMKYITGGTPRRFEYDPWTGEKHEAYEFKTEEERRKQ